MDGLALPALFARSECDLKIQLHRELNLARSALEECRIAGVVQSRSACNTWADSHRRSRSIFVRIVELGLIERGAIQYRPTPSLQLLDWIDLQSTRMGSLIFERLRWASFALTRFPT